MSVLVFVGVYLIGNPVDILISSQADQTERERAIVALGLTNRSGRNTATLCWVQ